MGAGRQCGMCGDGFSNPTPRAHELGGRFGQGVIVKSYVCISLCKFFIAFLCET